MKMQCTYVLLIQDCALRDLLSTTFNYLQTDQLVRGEVQPLSCQLERCKYGQILYAPYYDFLLNLTKMHGRFDWVFVLLDCIFSLHERIGKTQTKLGKLSHKETSNNETTVRKSPKKIFFKQIIPVSFHCSHLSSKTLKPGHQYYPNSGAQLSQLQ